MAEYLADLELGFDNLTRGGLFKTLWRWEGSAPNLAAAEANARRAARDRHPSLREIIKVTVVGKLTMVAPPGDH